jgi:hypothetical protein
MKKFKILIGVMLVAAVVCTVLFTPANAAKPALASDAKLELNSTNKVYTQAEAALLGLALFHTACNPPCAGGWKSTCTSPITPYYCGFRGTFQACYGCPE